MDFAVLVDHRGKMKESKKIEKSPRSCQRAEKKNSGTLICDINCGWCPWNSLQRLGKETGRNGDQRKKNY